MTELERSALASGLQFNLSVIKDSICIPRIFTDRCAASLARYVRLLRSQEMFFGPKIP